MTTLETTPLVPSFGDERIDRKLAIICSKGNLDMINRKTMGDLKFTMLGNTATHMPQGLGGLPGMTAMATRQMKKSIADLGVPDVPDFLKQIVDSGGHLWACRMSADMNHLTEEDLFESVEAIISAGEFIEKTEGAQLLFV